MPSVSFEIYAPAPQLVTAKIDDSYRKIILTFNEAAWSSKRNCKDMFSKKTGTSFGKRFKCAFKGKTQLVIYLGSKSTIKAGETISLLKDSIKARFQSVVEHTAATDINLSPPSKLLSPRAIISGLNTVGMCNKIKISGRKSRGAGGRALTYNWNVEFSSDVNIGSLSAEVTNGLTKLKEKLASLPSRYNTLHLKSDELAVSTESELIAYNFTLSVTNFLSEKSPTTHLVVTRVNDNLPEVAILGGRIQTMKTSRLNKVQGRARIPKCLSASGGLNFAWEIDNAGVELESKSKNSAVLYIYPGTLTGGETYELTLVVSLKSDPSRSTSVSVTLDVLSTQLVTRIRGGNRVVSGSSDFTLDGSRSFDPDREKQESWYEWECMDKDDLACFVKDPNNTDKYTRYQMNSTSKVLVKGGTLDSNQTYKFTLRYHKGFRVKSRTVKVKVLGGRPPIVSIYPQRKLKENINNKVVVRGRVASQIGNISVWVECVDSDEYAYINLTEPGVLLTPNNVVIKRKGKHRVGMVFNKNVLSGGVSYKFKMFARTSEGVGYSEIILTTNSPPSIGILESNIQNGTALTTEFTLSAVEGWEDDADDLPLSYNFGYFAIDGRKRYLGAPSYESEKVVSLPKGDPKNGDNLLLFVNVYDVHGTMSETTTTVSVSPLTFNTTAITDIKSTIDEAMASDDLSSALGTISSTISTFGGGEKGKISCLLHSSFVSLN